MDKGINNNGYEYVDLGLPSSTLWATCNVGADKPSDYGLYFQWGDTVGYKANQIGKDKLFDWSDYKWYLSGNDYDDNVKFKKYTTTGATLELEDDAAHANMGGDWHIPTPEQIQELFDDTTSDWTTLDGIKGITFTSNKDESKSIFIPIVGGAWGGKVHSSGKYGSVWSSMLSTDYDCYGQSSYFVSDNASLGDGCRYCGFPVRGVIDKNCNNSKEEKNNMNDNLNLVEILKDAPEGLGLWSYACGICEFKQIVKYTDYPIVCKTINKNGEIVNIEFTKEGKRDTFYSNAECVLFPSKENRDWSTFKVSKTHKHFEPYQKVLVKKDCDGKYMWFPDSYCFYDISTNKHYLIGSDWAEDEDIIPYEGNEDKVGKSE